MDTLAHSLWSVAIGHKATPKVKWYWLALVGAGPDLVWIPFTAFALITSGQIQYFQAPYNISHSLVIWLIVSLLLTIRWKNAFAYSWPWALHILIDVPGHTDMHTPILWPISDFKIAGWFDWLTARLLFWNYVVLIIVFIFLFITRHRPQKSISADKKIA